MLHGSGIAWDLRKVALYDKYDEVCSLFFSYESMWHLAC